MIPVGIRWLLQVIITYYPLMKWDAQQCTHEMVQLCLKMASSMVNICEYDGLQIDIAILFGKVMTQHGMSWFHISREATCIQL